jgi:hypothetical protein
MLTTTMAVRLPKITKTLFLEACETSGMSPAAVIIAFLEGWAPNANDPRQRAVPANEIRRILDNAKRHK